MTDLIQKEEQAFLNTTTLWFNDRPYHVMCHKNSEKEYAISLIDLGIGFTGENRLEIMGKIRRFLRDRQTK